jgi:hypothetical protein
MYPNKVGQIVPQIGKRSKQRYNQKQHNANDHGAIGCSPTDQNAAIQEVKGRMDKKIATAIQEQAREGKLGCADAFRIAENTAVMPLDVGETADALSIRLERCQLGLFGYGEEKRIVQPADQVPPELEQAIRDRVINGRLPCAEAWLIASQLGIPKIKVANAAEKLDVRISQCQLGAF